MTSKCPEPLSYTVRIVYRAAVGMGMKLSKARRWLLPTAACAALTLVSGRAAAQQPTFHLDRLEMGGAPDDGMVMFRPVVQPNTVLFGQFGIGYSLDPLRTTNIVNSLQKTIVNQSDRGVVKHQFTLYSTAGIQFLNRFSAALTFPFSPVQLGTNPNYPISFIGNNIKTTIVNPQGPSVGDLRLDLRGVVIRTKNEAGALGAQVSLYAPTGTNSNFGGDGKLSGWIAVTAEYDFRKSSGQSVFVLTANTGIMFRPDNSINDPPTNNGLGVGNEWRWALGGFFPLMNGKLRIGANIMGQTGIESDLKIDGTGVIGDTGFTRRNTPIEWNLEGRLKFGPDQHMWAGLLMGSYINPGYGAPDFRAVAVVGIYAPILMPVTESSQKDTRDALHAKWKAEHKEDADGDGIPDDLDACPMEAEDHEGTVPNDGCPAAKDRDGDGIPDDMDKCPDQAEDKDGIDDNDGCPEDDFDKDGIPDTTDACPKVPGKPNADPKKNGCATTFTMDAGGVIKLNQQVHFATGSANILPDSFPMLQEIANLLNVNKAIKKISVDGHTDNAGPADMNRKLSQDRANSVRTWLTGHGVDATRMEAHGYGPDKPIDSNATPAGRTNNRRVEFNILQQ